MELESVNNSRGLVNQVNWVWSIGTTHIPFARIIFVWNCFFFFTLFIVHLQVVGSLAATFRHLQRINCHKSERKNVKRTWFISLLMRHWHTSCNLDGMLGRTSQRATCQRGARKGPSILFCFLFPSSTRKNCFCKTMLMFLLSVCGQMHLQSFTFVVSEYLLLYTSSFRK